MQSLEEVERICYQNELDRAETWQNKDDEEPTAEESFTNCIHSDACRRAYYRLNMPITEREAKDGLTEMDFLPCVLGCDVCEEYEDSWCPMSLSGTMRCQGPRKAEK